MKTTERIRHELEALADPKYRDFQASLIPGTDHVLGVRIPQLRAMAKRMARTDDWKSFVADADSVYYEEEMLRGMVIGAAKVGLEERLAHVRAFLPRVDNWAVCDIFCGDLKSAVRQGKEEVWQFVLPYLDSEKEFEVRFGLVMLLHYVDAEYIDALLAYADRFRHEAYYARMAMAWLLSICFVKFPAQTLAYLKRSRLDAWTYNKALQKAIESLRVDKETKEKLRGMKRRKLGGVRSPNSP